ncbi:hypothetical protein Dimus_023236 [Dionaea muscipula]
MAKRGRPRKRGGLARPQATPRVPVHVVREANEEGSSPGKLIDVQPGVVEGVDDSPGSAAAQIGGKGMIPLEGSPYLRALKRDSEDPEFQLNPLAGNRDLNKGTPLSLLSPGGALAGDQRDDLVSPKLNVPRAQGKGKLLEEEWQQVESRVGSTRGRGMEAEGLLQADSLGSRFSILDGDNSGCISLRKMDEVAVVVDKQLSVILSPFSSPIT